MTTLSCSDILTSAIATLKCANYIINGSVVLASETVASDVGVDAARAQRGPYGAALPALRARRALAPLRARRGARALAVLAVPRLLALAHALPGRADLLLPRRRGALTSRSHAPLC